MRKQWIAVALVLTVVLSVVAGTAVSPAPVFGRTDDAPRALIQAERLTSPDTAYLRGQESFRGAIAPPKSQGFVLRIAITPLPNRLPGWSRVGLTKPTRWAAKLLFLVPVFNGGKYKIGPQGSEGGEKPKKG